MPATEGIQNYLKTHDFRLRGNDVKGRLKIFYEANNMWDFGSADQINVN